MVVGEGGCDAVVGVAEAGECADSAHFDSEMSWTIKDLDD